MGHVSYRTRFQVGALSHQCRKCVQLCKLQRWSHGGSHLCTTRAYTFIFETLAQQTISACARAQVRHSSLQALRCIVSLLQSAHAIWDLSPLKGCLHDVGPPPRPGLLSGFGHFSTSGGLQLQAQFVLLDDVLCENDKETRRRGESGHSNHIFTFTFFGGRQLYSLKWLFRLYLPSRSLSVSLL